MSFYHWRRRLRITGAAAAESVGVTSGVYRAQDAHDAKTLEASKAREAPRFLRLQVTDAVTASPPDALAVRFACGTELHCSPTHLATLVALLRQPSDAAAPTPAPHRPARQGVS